MGACSFQNTGRGKSAKDVFTRLQDSAQREYGDDCFAICTHQPVTNNNKIKSQVEHIVTPGTKKWVLKYVVYDFDNQLGSYLTKGDAVKAARAHTEKTFKRTTISMEKKLEKGNAQVATINYKSSSEEKDGQWIFFGYASE
jgi:hypothetical protein